MPITKTKVKKDGLQQYRVRVDHYDMYGKRKQIERTAYGLNEAKELEQTLLQGLKETYISKNITFKELYDEYYKEHQHDVRASSLAQTEKHFRLYILPFFQNLKMNQITVPNVKKWKQEMNETNLSITSKKNCFAALRALINYAIRYEYLIANPLLVVGNFKEPNFVHKETRMRVYTIEQFNLYIETLKSTCTSDFDWCFYVFFNIAFYTGLRKGEIHALKWSDLDGNILSVRRSITQKLKNGDKETPPKNQSSYRKLQIPNKLIEILNEQKLRQEKTSNFSNDLYICGGNAPLRDTTIDKKNRQVATLAKLPRITIHEFRHTHASLLIAQKINILEISRRLGHAKPTMTLEVYAHLFANEEIEVLNFLNTI